MKLLDFIAPFRKAIVAALAAAVLGFLAKRGVSGDATLTDGITAILNAIVGGGLVYLTKNEGK